MAMTVRYTVINGEIIAEKRNGVRRLYVPDALGSTVALLDSSQAKTDTFSYWPYGEEASRTGTTPTPFRFVGTRGYYRDRLNSIYVRGPRYRADLARCTSRSQGVGTGSEATGVYQIGGLWTSAGVGTGDPRCPGCTAGECGRILRQLDDIRRNRLVYVPYPDLQECLRKRCGNIVVRCRPAADPVCSITWRICGYTHEGLRRTINLCPSVFAGACGCLGRTILHEMIHSCGDVPEPDRDAEYWARFCGEWLPYEQPGMPPCPP